MLKGVKSANPNISNWNVPNVTDMSFMFSKATSANPDTSNWYIFKVTDMSVTFGTFQVSPL